MNIQIRYEKHFDPNLSGLVERTSDLKRSRIAYLSSFLTQEHVCFLKKSDTLQFPNCFVCCRRPSGPVVSSLTIWIKIFMASHFFTFLNYLLCFNSTHHGLDG